MLAGCTMRLGLYWIYIVLYFSYEISSYKHDDERKYSSNSSMNSCSLGEKDLPTNLDSINNFIGSNHSDPYLLEAYHRCWEVITGLNFIPFYSTLVCYNDYLLEQVCKTVSAPCVNNMRQCCNNAAKCCQKQLGQLKISDQPVCPMTWDGILCWNEMKEDKIVKLACPKYIPLFMDTEYAEKRCFLSNNKWHNYTNYTNCYKKTVENELLISQIKKYFLIISFCMLLVSIFIFVSFRSLRCQLRIKVHINLFATLCLRCIFELIVIISIINTYLEILLSSEENNARLEGCEYVTILLKYFQNSTFNWMLCEALLLYQLLFRTFEQISGIRLYLFIGWVVPLSYTGTYFFIRKFHPNYKTYKTYCSVEELPYLEYLLRGPNILVLLLNIVFLINIIRLIRNLPTQPHESSYSRRTFKAVIVLVPLFGLQLLLVAISLPRENYFYLSYTIFQSIVQDSTGIAVSLAFCAFNQEIFNTLRCHAATHLRNPRHRRTKGRKDGSINSRSMQRSSNSIPFCVRESGEHNYNIYTSDYQIPQK